MPPAGWGCCLDWRQGGGFATWTRARGPDPRAPGFFWCAGLGGCGIQTAPAYSALVAGTVLGRPPIAPSLLAETSAARLI